MYGVGGIPDVWFDGNENVVGGGTYMYPYYEPIVLSHLDDPSPLTMVAEYAMQDEYNGTLNVEIEVTDAITTAGNMVHFVLVEDDVYQDEPNIARAVLEDEPFLLTSPGQSVTIQRNFTIDPTWYGGVDPEKVHCIVIVQSHGGTNDVLQVAQAVEGTFMITPTVDIKCNGSDFPVTVIKPAPITLDIDVQAHDGAGFPVDIWALITADAGGWAAYDGSWNFPVTLPFTGHALASGPLADMSGTIFDANFPLAGTYTAYLMIDPVANDRYTPTARNIIDAVQFNVLPVGTPHVLIWNPSESSSGWAMANALDALGAVSYDLDTGTQIPDLEGYSAVFVDLGISPNNFVLLWFHAAALADFLDSGGNVYLEGGQFWYNDTPTDVHPYFGINDLSGGLGDTYNCDGVAGTFTEGMTFVYAGENNGMDRLEPVAPAYSIFTEQTAGYVNAVAHDAGSYKTIGGSFEFGGLVDGTAPSTKSALMEQYLTFFGLTD